ncbi:MAG: S-layer homology domain-containing protein [Bacillota bacterium]|nr:S-layer homology domain-containing protein [Bacillota bacterium]
MKKLLSLTLALVLTLALAVPAFAADSETETAAAWTLYNMGLFQGTGTDDQGFPVFDLDKTPTRAQGVTMLVRLLGQEETALAGEWTTSFQDVPDWAAPYVGYAYEKGLTTGRSETVFDPDTPIRAAEYLTFVLRALGYQSGEDFSWDTAWTLSDKLGFTDGSYNGETNQDFNRGDVAAISANALEVKPKGADETLGEKLEVLGIRDNTQRCLWEEERLLCQPNKIIFAFNVTKESPETYQKFVVDSVTVNGVACQVKQYSAPEDVKQLCKDLTKSEGIKVSQPDAFALVCLTYDESAAKAAAKESAEVGDQSYPVLSFRFHCTGTLADGTQVKELFSLPYYIDGYGSKYGDIFG